MSQNTHRDLEGGNDPDGHHHQPQSTPNQPLQGESNFGDSSGPLFSIYSKAAEEEDNKMVERWQKDADGILIFTGLFSAAVAALLAVTVQDLRPNSQDTSAFYLGNIYQVLVDPNATHASTPSPAKPPPFSPPKYAVWVNLLWFLSLVMSLSCALWATSLHQWARRYIRLTQPARCSPERRARMRAFFAEGVDNMHIPWAVEGLPTLLHLSLFLFFGGLVIFLFNLDVDQDVFTFVVWWIGLFSMVYGLITLLPLIRQDSPYYSPLSKPAWFPYTSIKYLTSTVLAFACGYIGSYETWKRYNDLKFRYRGRILWGVEKAAEEVALERSSEIDVRILGWTISALGDDDSLEKFFEAIPGFFNSTLVKDLERDFPLSLLETFWGALNGFMGRTLSSNSVTKSVKSRRDVICRDIMSTIPCPRFYMYDNLFSHFDQVPASIESSQAMARWITHVSHDVSFTAQISVAENLAGMQERNNRWIALVSDAYGLASRDIQHNVAMGGDNMMLATLIHASRQAIHSDKLYMFVLMEALTQFDICHTLPGLQRDFCTLWNELVQEARNRGIYSTPIHVIDLIRHLYNALHQGTDAAFPASPDSRDILLVPSLFPLCDIPSHHTHSIVNIPLLTEPPDSFNASPHHSTSGGSTISRKVKEASIIAGAPSPFDPTKPSKIGDSSQAPETTSHALALTVCPSLRPTDASLRSAIAGVLQDIPPVATQQNMFTPYTRPDISENLSTVSTPAPTPTLAASPQPVLNRSSTSCDVVAASTSDPLLPASSVVRFSIPVSPPSSRVPSLPKTPSHPTGDATKLRLRARGLVNTGSMCFANCVLQLLLHTPAFCDLFGELGDLKGQREARGSKTGGGATPLIDASVRFFEESVFKEKEPPMQQPPQRAGGANPREEDVTKEIKAVNPMYMYDAMKEKRRLKTFVDGQQQDAEEFFRLYLDALDEELLALPASSSGQNSATAPPGVEESEVSQSVQTDVEDRGSKAKSVESPMIRVFGGKFRSTLHTPNQLDTVTIEDWRPLQIDIQHESVLSIEDALARISHLQPVQLGPSGSNEASQQVLIEVLPSVLVLHLKRFLYDVVTDGIIKISKPIQFAPELEIPPEIMTPVPGKFAEPVRYKLYGVLYHHGESAASGHYTVDVLHPNEDSGSGEVWLHIDDEAVSAVRHEDVFRNRDNERVDERSAYMLFYCRTGLTQI